MKQVYQSPDLYLVACAPSDVLTISAITIDNGMIVEWDDELIV